MNRLLGSMFLLLAISAGWMAAPPDLPPFPAPADRLLPVILDQAINPLQNPKKIKTMRGRIVDPAKVAARHAEAFKRHGDRMGSLPSTTLAAFDCRTAFGNVLPVDDQGPCGDCFGVSSADGASMCLVKAGYGKADGSFRLSSQFGLDCGAFQGGCNGGDEAQVIDYIKTSGFPLTSDYGPYAASPGRCKDTSAMRLYKIADWGYCTPAQQGGVASTQDMKNAMVRYGPLSVAFDAGGCDSYVWPETMTRHGANVDHAVLCIAWDDNHDNGDGSKGAFIGMNQWGNWGGPGGTFWIKYGAWSWGTEAIWMSANPLPPPPIPPSPLPPTPPGPSPGMTTITLSNALPAGTYELSAAGTGAALAKITTDLQTLQGLQPNQSGSEPPLGRQPNQEASMKRLDALEASVLRLADSVYGLQKLIEGKSK